MSFMNIKETLNNFSKARIAVVGDIMLDSYVYGSVDRVSPEAPVPVVKVEKEIYELGGAGNVAANIASLGGNVFLFGYVGKDNTREILIKNLDEKGINSNLYDVLKQTIQKTRIIGNQYQITRIDREDYLKVSEKIEEILAIEILSKNPDIIIASDYAKGCLTDNLFYLIQNHNKGIRIIVDPKPKNKINYSGAYLITPNLKEGKELTGLEDINEIGRKLRDMYGCNVLLTLGKEGASLFEENKVINIPTQAKEVFDVTGAGDTMVAVMGLGLASGLNLEESCFLANHAAGIVVGKAGTATVSPGELEQVIESENRKIKNLEELRKITWDYQRKGKRIVWTNGCFDLLHVGHIDYLKKAREFGDYLIIGLNSDESVRKLKGNSRPIIPEKERAEIISSLECVNYVTIFSEKNVVNCLKELKPDVYVKGGDYSLDKMDQDERKIVESYNGKFVFIPFVVNASTSGIIEKIRNGES